jgi:hypothetical protein
MGTNHILEATNKKFSEKSIRHALYMESQFLKGGYKVFHYNRLFQLFSNDLNGRCQCQRIHKALPQILSKPHTLGGHFFFISTISNVLDLDGEHYTVVFPTQL